MSIVRHATFSLFKLFLHVVITLGLATSTVLGATEPITASWAATNSSLVLGTDFVSQTIGGVSITARGYTVEFDGPNTTIYGPYPTASGQRGLQVFGTATSGLPGQSGLGLLSQPLPGIPVTGQDFGSGSHESGFSNGYRFDGYIGDNPNIPGNPLHKMEFALFSFSSPVNISAVITDDVTNGGRGIWAAGGTSTADLSGGLEAAFAGFSIQNSPDVSGSDGPLLHAVNFSSISFLAVGAPIPGAIGQLGAFAASNRQHNFYISSFALAPVPEPASFLTMLAGLALLGLAWSRKFLS